MVEVVVSSDGQVRSATVKTASGLKRRPACKLAVLDVGETSLFHGGGNVTDERTGEGDCSDPGDETCN